MADIDKEKQKLVARIKRIRGQADSIERSLTAADDCVDVLMLRYREAEYGCESGAITTGYSGKHRKGY